MTFFHLDRNQNVPAMDSANMGILILLLNIFLPGIGSIIAGNYLLSFGMNSPANRRKAGILKSKTSTIIIGIIQFLTSVFILGWIFSIWQDF
jgi:hypothetical protein